MQDSLRLCVTAATCRCRDLAILNFQLRGAAGDGNSKLAESLVRTLPACEPAAPRGNISIAHRPRDTVAHLLERHMLRALSCASRTKRASEFAAAASSYKRRRALRGPQRVPGARAPVAHHRNDRSVPLPAAGHRVTPRIQATRHARRKTRRPPLDHSYCDHNVPRLADPSPIPTVSSSS